MCNMTGLNNKPDDVCIARIEEYYTYLRRLGGAWQV
jgi:hypothetical protein